MLALLLAALAIAILIYAVALFKAFAKQRIIPNVEAMLLGAVTEFFDTLGIGAYAPTIAWFKIRNMVADRLIPSTMIVGHTPPAMLQAVIFLIISGVLVDPVLLFGCVIAVMIGGLIGAPLVSKARVWVVQMGVAIALLLAAIMYMTTNLDMMPGGGTASSLPLNWMAVAIFANFIFGILLNFGVGNYAPTLIMLSLMGMDPKLAFPIMAAGAALAGTGASVRHIAMREIDLRIAIGITLGGIPAVILAAFVVKNLSVEMLRWLVIFVVCYTSIVMFRAAMAGRRSDAASQI